MEDGTLLGSYRVLDLCNETGALCGKIFADLGSDVIKIEKPGGDPARNIGPFYHDIPHPEKSLFWFAYNTSKRGITLDIETKQGQEIFKKLVKSADFVFETLPPGYMSNLGLGYDELGKLNLKIIMTSITPFGQTGPYKDFKSSDLVSLAMGGAILANGDPDRAPLRYTVEQSYPQAGAQAAAASMAALHYRQMTGEGQHVDVSIQICIDQSLGGMIGPPVAGRSAGGRRQGTRMERANFRALIIFPAKDGYVSWRVFVADQGPKTNAMVDLMREWGEVEPELESVDFTQIDANKLTQDDLEPWEEGFARFFAKHTKVELHREAVKRDMFLLPVNTIQDLVNDEHLHARQFWVNVEHPELGATIAYPGAPFKLTETPWRISRQAPLIGEHNEEIYEKELGMTKQQLYLLKEQGII